MAAKQRQNPELCIFDAALSLIVLIGTAIEKHILLPGMTMHITIQSHFALPLAKTDQLLAVVNTGM